MTSSSLLSIWLTKQKLIYTIYVNENWRVNSLQIKEHVGVKVLLSYPSDEETSSARSYTTL